MHPDALGPTAPQQASPPVPRPLPPLPPLPMAPTPGSSLSSRFAVVILIALVIALVIGVVIGRASSPALVATTPPPSVTGRLHVQSSPVDGNVVVDGRFAGVAPIERIDLDPGKHSVVIDAFGYQPCSGTLQIEPHGTLNLAITLAAVGDAAATSGSFTGVGTVKYMIVPPSALLPTRTEAAPHADPVRKQTRPPAGSPPQTLAPATARRDCSGEQSRCREGCSHAESDCRFSCTTCTSCLTSVGWDECHRQCDQCRSGCEQNTKFCESSCDSQYGSCQASQP